MKTYRYESLYSLNDITVRVRKLPGAYEWRVIASPNEEDVDVTSYTDVSSDVWKRYESAFHVTDDGKYIILAGGNPLRIVALQFDNAFKEMIKLFERLSEPGPSATYSFDPDYDKEEEK